MTEENRHSAEPSSHESETSALHVLAPDLAYRRLGIVNVAFYGLPDTGGWVLIDAGLPGTAGLIVKAAEARFGSGTKPAAIILTHGHFDHVGALLELAERWDVPIYAHVLEHPYLNGASAYPPPDPTVGGGLMARLAGFYPKDPIDVSRWLRPLPEDGSVPEMTSWRWLATPGHTPGHVSLWRDRDRLLVVGDAFVTTKQESAYAVAVQKAELHGPPMYYTSDWVAARRSVEALAALRPETVVSGHGPTLQGYELRTGLEALARDFRQVAIPKQGRYVRRPARADERGVRYIPPKQRAAQSLGANVLAGTLLTLTGGWLFYRGLSGSRNSQPQTRRFMSPSAVSEVGRSLTVGKPAAELYELWLEPHTFARIMAHFAEVQTVSRGRAHWIMHAPLGRILTWDTETVEARPGELVRWRSLPGAALTHQGSVSFRPAPRDWGTVVELKLEFNPPGGVVGAAAAKLLGLLPEALVGKTLRRFKSLVETGEIPTLAGNPSARGRGDSR